MTTQTIVFESAIQPATVNLVPWGGGTAIAASAIGAASGNRAGWFQATVTDVVGKYSLHGLDSGGNTVVTDVIIMLNTTNTQYVLSLLGANVQAWQDTMVPAPDTAGYPVVTLKRGTGAGEVQLTSGILQADIEQLLGSVPAAQALSNLVNNLLVVTVSNHSVATTTVFQVTAASLSASQLAIGAVLRVPTVGADAKNAGALVTVTNAVDIALNIVELTVTPALPAVPSTSTKLAAIATTNSQMAAAVTELTAVLSGTDGYTLLELLQLGIAVLCGESSGADGSGGIMEFRSLDGAKVRVTANCDTYGNRGSITLNPD